MTPGAAWELTTVKTGSTLVTDTIPTTTGPAILGVPKAEVDAIPDGMIATGPGTKLAVPKGLVEATPTGEIVDRVASVGLPEASLVPEAEPSLA